MKRLFALSLALAIVFLLLSSCFSLKKNSPSDELSTGKNESLTKNEENTDKKADTINSQDDKNDSESAEKPRVRLVLVIHAENVEGLNASYYYEYDKMNRIVKITVKGGPNDGVCNVTYPTLDTIHYEFSNSYSFTLTFGGEYITKYKGNMQGLQMNQTLEYESRYLKRTETFSVMNVVNSYIWSEGLLEKIEMKAGPAAINTLFSYSDIPNMECNISPWTTSHQYNWYTPTYLCGSMTSYLVSTEKREIDGKTIEYRYITDSEGYVTHVYGAENGGAEQLLYEIEYR